MITIPSVNKVSKLTQLNESIYKKIRKELFRTFDKTCKSRYNLVLSSKTCIVYLKNIREKKQVFTNFAKPDK